MTTRNRFVRSLAVSLAAALTLALSACGSDDTPTPVASTTSTPSTTSSVSVTIPSSSEPATTTAEPPVTTSETPTVPAPPAVDALVGGTPSGNVLVAAKIDNTFPGKQWGVAAADVVYVEMVEGQLSRLIALFHTNLPDEVGPVRSVRSTDPDVLTAYGQPALMFSGGAGGPLDNFAESGLVNASFDVIGGAYWRSKAASEPYNLHANVAEIATDVPGIGVPTNPGFVFGDDYPAMSTQREVGTVRAAFANPVSFRYVDGHYNYIRRDSVQTDGATGETFEFANLLVQRTTAQTDGTVDSNGVPSYKTNSIGSGSFTLYRDGHAVDGTWTRADAASPTSYVDASGVPVLFHTGKTWVVLAPEQITVTEG